MNTPIAIIPQAQRQVAMLSANQHASQPSSAQALRKRYWQVINRCQLYGFNPLASTLLELYFKDFPEDRALVGASQ